MRVLLLLGLVLALAGFDHIVHDRDLDVKGVGVLPCARCHVESHGKLVGKPGHTACFGECHGDAPKRPRRGAKPVIGDAMRLCTSCHDDAVLARPFTGKLPARYPPYREEPDFNIAFGHQQHGAVACTLCHDLRAKPAKTTPHQRCLGCHDGSGAAGHGPAMSACAGCHPRAVGMPQPPELTPLRDSVSAVFSHARHAARGNAGKDCATCHAPIRATNDTELPRPTQAECATGGCHDGKAAFATTVACTRCHDHAPDRFEVARPTERFTHSGVHADVVKARTCNACHPLSARGEIEVSGHAACSECHAADFGARSPKICGACHNASEPWRKLVADRALPDRTEFGAMIDHTKHRQACTTCHTLRTAGSQLRTPRGHAACLGSGCHANRTGPVPRFETCNGCHRLGLASEREATRLSAPWSVRRAFDHATHRRTHDDHDVACTACHTQLGGNVLELATPQKPACLPCHDTGKGAFKLTGTTCTRCHDQAPLDGGQP
ncbi:MAG TPA: cytochrome c3 family protein [Kofleriaceae bacterium]|nr:cytochrome c3 family protein [Kofleriaceae bacterium]